MIPVELSVVELIEIVCHFGFHSDLGQRLSKSLSANYATASNGEVCVTVSVIPVGNKISAIRCIRAATGWGLLESKEFCDRVIGKYDGYGYGSSYSGGRPEAIKLPADKAKTLCVSLREVNCEASMD